MKFRAQHVGDVAPGKQFAEVGIVTHEGRDFSAGGACVTDDYVIAYLTSGNTVSTWEGQPIGKYHSVKSWPTPRSYLSSRMHQIYLTLDDGRCYTGRSGGAGLIVKAKRIAKQKRVK